MLTAYIKLSVEALADLIRLGPFAGGGNHHLYIATDWGIPETEVAYIKPPAPQGVGGVYYIGLVAPTCVSTATLCKR
jgi:hypothetical protein